MILVLGCVAQWSTNLHTPFALNPTDRLFPSSLTPFPSCFISLFEQERAWCLPAAVSPQSLNLQAVSEAAAILVGKHNFNSFRASKCQGAFPHLT